MSTNSVGRTVYSSLEIIGALICLFITLSLVRRLFCNSSRQSQSKQVMQPTHRMKICAVSCSIVLFFGFIMRSLIISSVINEHNIPSVSVQVLDHFGNLLMDLGQTLYFKYLVLSIRKLYRFAPTAISLTLISTAISPQIKFLGKKCHIQTSGHSDGVSHCF